jgi:hypothetical protein
MTFPQATSSALKNKFKKENKRVPAEPTPKVKVYQLLLYNTASQSLKYILTTLRF